MNTYIDHTRYPQPEERELRLPERNDKTADDIEEVTPTVFINIKAYAPDVHLSYFDTRLNK